RTDAKSWSRTACRGPLRPPPLAGDELLGDRDHTVAVGLHQTDTGAAIDDVVGVQRALMGHRVLEFRAGDVNAFGHWVIRPLAAGRGDHVRRLGAVAGDQ